MIVDAVLGWFFNALTAVVGLLPDAGDPPDWIQTTRRFVESIGYLVPVHEFIAALPYILSVYGVLLTWRIIRFARGG